MVAGNTPLHAPKKDMWSKIIELGLSSFSSLVPLAKGPFGVPFLSHCPSGDLIRESGPLGRFPFAGFPPGAGATLLWRRGVPGAWGLSQFFPLGQITMSTNQKAPAGQAPIFPMCS